jgi:hypothetical protein
LDSGAQVSADAPCKAAFDFKNVKKMSAILRILVLLACAIGTVPGFCQSLYYVESGNAACPVRSAPTAVAPTKVRIGASVSGSISVSCGFGGGSYTVTLNSTDPGAKFSPKSFLVNFGSISGDGVFTVTFATAGVQTHLGSHHIEHG